MYNCSLLALTLLALLLGCSRSGDDTTAEPLAIYVAQSGQITIGESVVTLEEAQQQIAALAGTSTVIRYSRANPGGDPPPNAMEIIAAIIEAELPVQMEP